jgi:sugar O-acyltransferase (sialic acid O-acetyltransferase NeuD family)
MSFSPLFGVYGAAGFGRGVMPLVRQKIASRGIASDRLVFVDDDPKAASVNGHRIMQYEEFLATPADERHIAVAIANGRVRERLALSCAKDGVKPLSVAAANMVIMDEVKLGEGAILCSFVSILSNIVIGRYFHANMYSYVTHDCIVGDFVTFAPCVQCNGNIIIEDHVYVGAGAIIKQGTPDKPLVIGHGATIGMGAVVTKSVPAGVTVIGNPAKIMTGKNYQC